jgi:hypothetical protein
MHPREDARAAVWAEVVEGDHLAVDVRQRKFSALPRQQHEVAGTRQLAVVRSDDPAAFHAITRAGLPNTVVPSGMSFTTTAPAPT